MHHRETRFRECLAKAGFKLRRETDLRHEHERLLAVMEHPRDQVEIDLGLPAAGDAVQQDGREPTESRGDALHCTCLVRNERMRWCEAGGGGQM